MFAQERRQAIIDMLHLDGRVEVTRLASLLGVAEETIRRDLRWLEVAGQAVRTHGGALLCVVPGGAAVGGVPGGAAPTLSDRQGVSLEAKRSIGLYAANMISEGESVLIDSGSTTLEIARALRKRLEQTQHSNRADVHVVTNSLTVAAELAGAPHVAITVLGGTLHAAELCLVGPETLIALSHYRLDRVFVACAGIDTERGLAAANPFEAEVKRAMLRGASSRVVVADSSKLGHTALVQVAGLDSLDILITNSMAAPHIVADIRTAGVQVELV